MAVIRDVFTRGGADVVLREEAITMVADQLGYQRISANIYSVLHDALRTAARRCIVVSVRDQLWLATRSVSQYTLDHMVGMLLNNLSRVWVDRDDLIVATARQMGYRRTGSQIRAALKSAINAAIRRGRLESNGSQVRRV
jgi:hypothetical protein